MKLLFKLFLFLTIVFWSCGKKESRYPYLFAGGWSIESVDTTYYEENGSIKSQGSKSQCGILYLLNTTSNEFEIEEQYASFKFSKYPPQSIVKFCGRASINPINEFNAKYMAGPHGTERLTIWIPQSLLHELVMFTVNNINKNEITWIYTEDATSGNLAYKETWTLKRIE